MSILGAKCEVRYDAELGFRCYHERTRRLRARRKRGAVLVQFEVIGTALDDLIVLGWLPAEERGDKDAVTGALIGLMSRALGSGLRPL